MAIILLNAPTALRGGTEPVPEGWAQAPGPSLDIEAARLAHLTAQDLYLEAFHGDRPLARIIHVRLRDGHLLTTVAELRALDIIAPGALPRDDHEWITLDQLPGLSYHYDRTQQRLVLTVPPQLRPQQQLGYQPPGAVQAQRDSGWLLAYDLYGQGNRDRHTLALGHTVRWFGRAGALESSGSLRGGDLDSGYRRLDTTWTYSDPVRMQTWSVGDLISGGQTWSRPVRMGGVQWRRNFATRPDLVTVPIPRFRADVAVPSAVELYIDNIRQFGSPVQDGPLVIDTVPRIGGAGLASLILTDDLGRVSQTSVPLYTDNQRLAPGLHDYSIEAGWLRRGYGSDDDRYLGEAVFSASSRHGVTPTLTAESHVEFGSGLRLAGLGLVWVPGNRWGLISGAYARSDGDVADGSQYSLGYQWQSRRYGVDLQHLRRSSGFRDLGDLADLVAFVDAPMVGRVSSRRGSDRATTWLALPRGSLSYSWLRQLDHWQPDIRVHSLSWQQNLAPEWSLIASVFDADGQRGGGLSINRVVGERTLAQVQHARGSDGRGQTQAGLQRSAPYHGGWGWSVRTGEREGRGLGHASAQVRGRYGEGWFGIEHDRVGSTGFVQARGSVVRMAGRTFLSRYIHDGFAVVSTHGIADVLVHSENRPYGRTDRDGFLLLPDLRSWQDNLVGLDPDDLGAGIRVDELARSVTPAERSGVLVPFRIQRSRPALLVLMGLDDQPLPAGTRVRVGEDGPLLPVGFDGEVYLEDTVEGMNLQFPYEDGRCLYRVPAPDPASIVQRHRALACEWQAR